MNNLKIDCLLNKKKSIIGNAGIAIAATFLPILLEKSKLGVGSKIINPVQAVCLVYYLGSGEERARDNDLLLPKFCVESDLEKLSLLPYFIRANLIGRKYGKL